MKTANEIGKGFNLAHDFWKITVHQSKEDPQQEPLEAMAAGARDRDAGYIRSPGRKQKASEASLYPSKPNPIALYLPAMPQVQKVHNLTISTNC